MNRLLLALPAIALAAACATSQRPYAPVQNVRYSAIGHDPFWMVTIGDDRIVLRLGHDGGEEAGEYDEVIFPRTLPTQDGNVQWWVSNNGTENIRVETRETPTPCEIGRQSFQHFVRVALGDRIFNGCGGRLVRPRR